MNCRCACCAFSVPGDWLSSRIGHPGHHAGRSQGLPGPGIGSPVCAEWWFRDRKTSLDMERLSCKSPRLVHKELGMFLLAYNLIRALVVEAGAIHEVPVDRIRFKGTVDASRQSSIAIAPARSKKKQRELVSDWLPESLLRTSITTNSPANCGPLANPSSSKPQNEPATLGLRGLRPIITIHGCRPKTILPL